MTVGQLKQILEHSGVRDDAEIMVDGLGVDNLNASPGYLGFEINESLLEGSDDDHLVYVYEGALLLPPKTIGELGHKEKIAA